jgi:phage/plasmid-associated DNA primase
VNIAHHPDIKQHHSPTEPELDFEQELKLEEQSRNALYESVNILTYKGVKGDAMLLELLKVNLQLPRPVPLQELPIIADYNYSEENFLEDYTRVANMLEEAARPPEPTPIPTKIDIDRIIASADLQTLYAHVDELVAIRARSPIEWSLKKEQIKKAFGKGINLNDLERVVAGEQRKQEQQVSEDEPDVADIARDWAYTQREEWAYDMRAKVWRHWNGLFWEELEPKCPELNNQAVDALHAAGKDINTQSGMDTFLRCAADARAMIFPESQGRLVNFANGTLDTTTSLMLPHRREDYLTYCLPYNYVPGQHQRISDFLEQAVPDVYSRHAYMAHLGLALMRDTKLHNVVIMLGRPRSGKSTLLALANLVCGAAGHEAFSFADHHIFSRELEGKRSRYAWRDRRLVGVDEVPTEALREEEIFKQMSAHSGVGMRGMNKDDHKDNRWKPKLLLAANDRPRYADVTGAVRQRAIFIECPNHRPVGQRDLDLIDGLGEELGAFAASCIFMAQAVLERGYYPMSNQMKMTLESIDREGSYLKSFLAQQMIVDLDGSTVTDFAYQMYRSFCQDNHVRDQYQLTKEVFSRHITSMGIGVVAKKVLSSDGKYVRGLVGIRMRQEQDGWETEDEELRKYQFDEPLIDGVLTVVDGKMTVQKIAVSEVEQPVEPSEQEPLTAVTDKSENEISIETTLVEAQPPEATTSGSSIELVIVPDLPSMPSDEPIEQPVEPVQTADGYIEPVGLGVCGVKDCGQEVPVWDVEQAEKYGCWCSDHNDRAGLLLYGEALGYPHLQHTIYSAITAGEDHWKRFVTFPGAPVEHCLQYAEDLLRGQDCETA